MQESSTLGLRERKRAKTSEAIHRAAIELALERGLDEATIDAISERAEISPRTFFNYFPSKEDAVLGLDGHSIADELDQTRETPADVLSGALDLVRAMFEAKGGRASDFVRTREVLQKNPQLMTRHMMHIAELEDRLSGIIARWMSADPRFSGDTEAERLDQAHIILGICMATVRISMRAWATQSDSASGIAPIEPQKTYERSIETLRTVLEKLP